MCLGIGVDNVGPAEVASGCWNCSVIQVVSVLGDIGVCCWKAPCRLNIGVAALNVETSDVAGLVWSCEVEDHVDVGVPVGVKFAGDAYSEYVVVMLVPLENSFLGDVALRVGDDEGLGVDAEGRHDIGS